MSFLLNVAGKATTDEELEEMLEGGNSAVFTAGVRLRFHGEEIQVTRQQQFNIPSFLSFLVTPPCPPSRLWTPRSTSRPLMKLRLVTKTSWGWRAASKSSMTCLLTSPCWLRTRYTHGSGGRAGCPVSGRLTIWRPLCPRCAILSSMNVSKRLTVVEHVGVNCLPQVNRGYRCTVVYYHVWMWSEGIMVSGGQEKR